MDETQSIITEEELNSVGVASDQSSYEQPVELTPINTVEESKTEVEDFGLITEQELNDFYSSGRRDAAIAVTANNPSVAAEERTLAKELGTTRLDIRTNLEERRKAVEKRKIEMELEEAPSLTAFLSNNTGDAPILREGIHELVAIEHAYAAKKLARYGIVAENVGNELEYSYETPDLELSVDAVTGWQAAREDVVSNATIGSKGGYATVNQGLLWAKLREGQIERNEEFNKLSAEYDEAIRLSQENDSWVAAGAEFLGIMAGVMTQAPDAKTASVVGGMAAAATATGVGSIGAAGLLGATWLAGSAMAMYNLEGGLAYKDMIEAGTDESVARDTSRFVGFTNAMIEVAGLKLVGKAFAPAIKMLTAKNSAKVAQALSEPTMKAVMVEAAKGLGKSAVAEVGTEIIQELVNVAGEQVAREYGKANFNEFNSEEIFDRLYDVATRTFKGVAVIGGLGLGPTIVAGAAKVHRAETVRDHYKQISMGLSSSEIAKQSPDVVAEAIQEMENHYDSGNYYIDADELRQVCIQLGISTDELRQVMPELADKLEQKAVNKEDVEVPAGEFLTKVAPTPLGEALANHVRKNQEDLSYNDAMKLRTEVAKDLRAVMTKDGIDEQAIDNDVKNLKSEKMRKAFKDLSNRYYNAMKLRNETAEKKFTEQEMRTQAKWGAWVAVSLARRANMNPEEVAKFAPEIGVRDEGKLSQSDLLQQKDLSAANGTLSESELDTVNSLDVSDDLKQAFIEEAKKIKQEFSKQNGWAGLELVKVAVSKKGEPKFEWKKIAYSFDRNREGKTIEKGTAAYSRRVNALVHLLVEEVRSVYNRAKENDVDAFEIIRQAGWYRNMRARLRDEFGGAGDLLADLLGATSPNTPVKDNWANAIDIVRRLTRGDWDELIPQWEAYDKEFAKARVALKEFVDARLAEGMTQKAIKELPEYQALLADRKEKGTLPKELLPRKENGSLYNFNSGNAVRAILDHWREVKDAQDILGEGATAPKALTFSGNLIGFRDRATIDVWAARLLQRLAGKPRIPSRAETGVTGDMLSTGETTLQFGMGQDVFHKAAEIIRNDPELSSDPTLSRVSDDDLQAVAWFIEKEIWSKNGWTTAEGAGGSFEFEADLEGNPDREGIKKARSILNRATTTPEQKAEAQEFLDAAKDRTSRWLGGLSMQTSSETQGVAHIPSNDEQANAAQQLLLAALESENADRLIAFRANSTFGVYGKDRERSFDLELSTRSGFTPTKLFREMVQIAFDNNQDSMFISRVLKDGETVDYSRHRPGVEVYFKEGKKLEDLGDLLKQIESKGVKFYTLITDARRSTSAISGEDQKVVGIRFQCVPEFDARYGTPAPSGKQWSELSEEEIINEVKRKELEFINLATEVGSIEGVTLAKQYWYATTAIFNNEYEGILNDQNQNDNAGSSQGSVQTSNRERDGSGVVGNAAASSADHVGRTASASRQAQEESSGALALPYAKPESLNRGTSIKEAIKRSVGDELHQGSAGSRGSYSKNANRITLTPNSDLSTFAHEMGHWYLDALFALYNHKGVSPTIREDVETMLKEFGLKSIDEWFALSRKEREVLHERFAFYVEKYLAEGVAPTRQTRGFFSRLGKWICDVYKQFSDDPQSELDKHYEERFGVQLPQMSEEVRRVLDRMVASEQQIKTAQAAEGLQPLFETKPEDMSDEQWAEYLAYMDEAESEAIDAYLERVARDERWYADAKSRVLKQIQEEAKEVRQQVRERIEKQVDESPIAKIAEALKQSDIRLYEQDLVSQGFSEKQINVLRKHGLLVKSNEENRGKYQASTIATVRQWASFAKRYSNNREFVLDLVKICQREKLIEDLTTKQCLKDHSELFNEKARAAYAAELLHNESRGRMLATELSYLANDKTNSRVVREAAKIAAERMIAKEKVGKVTVKRYLAAEARAARKAYECLKNGDRHGAVVAKRAQLVNHEAALLAIEAEKRVKRISALKARIFKSDSKIAKTHDVGILSIARHIMTMMGIGRVSPSEYRNDDADKYLEKLRKYDEDKYNAFVSIIDKYGYRGDVVFADLPYETAMELLDDVQSLYRMAREAKQLLLEGRKLDREKVVDELLDTFNSVPRDNFDGGKESAIPESRKAAWHLMSIKAQLMRVENWCRAMDRGSNGPFFRYIFAPVANSAAMFRNANIKMQEALLNIVKPMQEKWASVRDIAAPEINYTFTTKAELIGALLHTGNQSNKNKMLLGGRGEDHPWATMRELPDGTTYVDTTNWDAFVNRCIDQGIITKEDMDAVQAIWDLTESTKEVAQKAFMALYGHYFEEVEATPIVTKWGTYRGGYVPAITEKYMVPERKTYEELERVTEQEFVSQMPVHEPGFSKSRVPNYTKPLALDVGLICGHVQQVLKFAFIAPVAHEVAKILNDKRFREAIDKHNSSWIPDMLQPWLKRSYTQSVSDGKTGIVSKTFNKFRSIAGMNIMIGHFVNALQQATGLSVAASKVDAKYLARACSKLMNRDGIIENMIAASPYMKARLDDRAMEFQSEIEKIVSKAATFAQAKTFVDKLAAIDAKMDPARDLLFRKGYLLQTAMQAPIDAIVWTAAYEQAIDNGLSYKDAVNEADSVVRTTQSDFSPENLARVETGSAFLRAFLVFYNYFGMQLNLLGEKWEGAKYTRKYGQFAYDAMLIVSIPSILSAVIAQMFMGFDTGDDDEWDVYDALRLLIAEPVKNVIAMVPWFGGAINTGGAMAAKHGEPMAQFIWGADPYQSKLLGSPSADMFTNSMKAMSQLYKAGIAGEEVNARSTVRNTIDLISVMTRMPLGFLKKPLGYIAAVENREERPRDAIEYARGLVTGRGQD